MSVKYIDGKSKYRDVPPKRAAEFAEWCRLLTPKGLKDAQIQVQKYVAQHDHVQLNHMAPGAWTGTPAFQAIHDAVSHLGENVPRFFLGLILFQTLAADDEQVWLCCRAESGEDSDEPSGLVYWPSPEID